jgi:hypothetical protein
MAATGPPRALQNVLERQVRICVFVFPVLSSVAVYMCVHTYGLKHLTVMNKDAKFSLETFSAYSLFRENRDKFIYDIACIGLQYLGETKKYFMMMRFKPRHFLNARQSSERGQHSHHHCVCPGCLQYEQLCHKQGVNLSPSWWVLVCPDLSFLVLDHLLPTLVGAEGYCCTWSHPVTHTYTHAQSVGLLWTRDRPPAEF